MTKFDDYHMGLSSFSVPRRCTRDGNLHSRGQVRSHLRIKTYKGEGNKKLHCDVATDVARSPLIHWELELRWPFRVALNYNKGHAFLPKSCQQLDASCSRGAENT